MSTLLLLFLSSSLGFPCAAPPTFHQTEAGHESRQGLNKDAQARDEEVETIAEEIRVNMRKAFESKHDIKKKCSAKLVELVATESSDAEVAASYIRRDKCISLLDEVRNLSVHQSEKVREIVATILGAVPNHSSLNTILKLLDDKDGIVRAAALQAHCSVAPRDCRARLSDYALNDSSWQVRKSSVRLAGQLGYEFSITEKVALLEDSDSRVADSAIDRLSCIDVYSENVLGIILNFVKDRSEEASRAKQSAIVFLGKCEVSTAGGTLVEVFTREDLDLPREVGNVLEDDIGLTLDLIRLINAMVRCCGTQAKNALESFALRHSSPPETARWSFSNMLSVLVSVFEALGEVGDHESAGALKNGISDPYYIVRLAAVEAIEKLDLVDECEAELTRLAQEDPSEYVKKSAMRALRTVSRTNDG